MSTSSGEEFESEGFSPFVSTLLPEGWCPACGKRQYLTSFTNLKGKPYEGGVCGRCFRAKKRAPKQGEQAGSDAYEQSPPLDATDQDLRKWISELQGRNRHLWETIQRLRDKIEKLTPPEGASTAAPKVCSNCKQEKLTTDFYRATKGGRLFGQCKECMKKKANARNRRGEKGEA